MLRASSRPPANEREIAFTTSGGRRRFTPPRWLLISGGAAIALFIVLGFSFGPIVRSKIAREAERRKLDVDVGSVRPGFFAVGLKELKVRPRGAPGIELKIDDMHVDLSAGLSVQKIEAHGGGFFIEGEPDDVVDRLKELRKGGAAEEKGDSAKRSRLPVSVDGLTLSWKLPSGGELSGTGLRASRDENATKLGCASCSARTPHKGGVIAVEVTGVEVELAPEDNAPRKLNATTLDVSVERPKTSVAPKATAKEELVPPPLPVAPPRKGAKAAPPVKEPAAPEEPVLPLPDLHALRTRIATTLAAFAPRLPDGGSVEIGGLSAKLDSGKEPIAFGPGQFTLTRRGDRVHLGFATNAGEERSKSTPLSIDADLPVGAGDVTAQLAGGPVSLAMLGVKEGMKGLTDVGRGMVSGKGQLVLSAAGDALTFDGQLTLRSITLNQPKIAPEVLRGIDFTISARGVLDDHGKLRVDDGQLDMGALHVRAHGTIEETSDHFAIALGIDVAPAACQSLLDSSPHGLLPLVRTARMGGTFAASLNLAFDTRTIDRLALDYKIDDQCKMLEVPRELSRDRFTESFTYRTYHPDGTTGETTTGPGTPSWTDLEDISPFMIAAVLTTEDGAFYKHKGFNHSAIRSSVQANLKARRFVRGASTITMQLAKNLFLAREKAMSRKIEEVVLTDYLEQIFRKDDMMELYLNVVEFGPDIYGITQAAEHYFGRKPEELHLTECFFLASLLPSPIRYGKLWEKGEVSETWMKHLKALMEIAARNGKISPAELEDGLKEGVVFYRPGDPRPEPRKPVTGARRDESDGDDTAWRPLD